MNRPPTTPTGLDRFTHAMAPNLIDYAELDPVNEFDDLFRYRGNEHIIEPGSTESMKRALSIAEQIQRTGSLQDADPVRRSMIGVLNAPTPSGVMIIRPDGPRESSYAQRATRERTAIEQARRKAERDADLDAHVRPITVANMTIAEAARVILDNRGRLDVTGSGLIVHAPVGISSGPCQTAATVLYAAERQVIAWHEAKRKGSLPDQQVTPNGTLV